jgi:hypothetical protein
VLLLLAGTARAQVDLSLKGKLGAGYAQNPYLDAAVLPEEGATTDGAMIAFAPGGEISLGRPGGHRGTLGYNGALRQLFLDENNELMLDHSVALTYTTAPFAEFRLALTAAGEQLYVREADGMGWLGGWASLRLSRSLGYAVRGSLAYIADYTRYAEESAASWELAHRAQAKLAWRLARGLVLEPGYTFSLVQADPGELASLQHLAGLSASWDVPWLPLDLRVGYSLTVLSLAQYKTMSGGKPQARPEGRTDLVHQVHTEVTVELLSWLGLFARWDGLFGRSDLEIADYTRHLVVGGVVVQWGYSSSAPVRPPSDTGALRLQARLPGAKSVAVVGSFNDWNPGRDPMKRQGELWVRSLSLPPGRHEVMLWVDGETRLPPDCPSEIPDGFGGMTCVVTIER